MSITVAKLVRGGYITRKRDKKDARCIGLTLTPAGSRVKEQNSVLDPDLVRTMLQLMQAAELENALQGVEAIAKYASILLRQRKRERNR